MNRTIKLNGEAIKRGRLTLNLSQRALARNTDIRLGFLLKLESGGSSERVTLGQLYKLADALSVDVATLLSDGRASHPPKPDDVLVEAALAQVGKAVNKDDLAWALGWEPGRVTDALAALAARLEATGQRLRQHKFGWWGLSPAVGVLGDSSAADLDRATLSEFGLRLSHAKILHKLLAGRPLRRLTPTGADKATPVGELLRARLVSVVDDGVVMNADVAFSLCLDDVPVASGGLLRPQRRKHRAVYSQNLSRTRTTDSADWRATTSVVRKAAGQQQKAAGL